MMAAGYQRVGECEISYRLDLYPRGLDADFS